jgi:hypothetical protein
MESTSLAHAPQPDPAGSGCVEPLPLADYAADALARSDRGPALSWCFGGRLLPGLRLAGLPGRRASAAATVDSLLDDVVRATRRLMRAVRAAHAGASRPVGRSGSVVVDDLARQHMREVLRRLGMVPR